MKTPVKPLSSQAVAFVDFLLTDPKRNQERAAARAGYSVKTASPKSTQLMKDPRVKALIAERTKTVTAAFELTQADVLRDLFLVVKADSRDLSEYRIGCCRYCHGANFMYQMTPQEYRDRLAAYVARVGDKDPACLQFNMQGGVGYDKRKKPHPDCPECFGEGEGREVFKDSRTLSESARTLYNGVKRTKNGLEIMSRDKDRARELAARHTGVIKQAGSDEKGDSNVVEHIDRPSSACPD
jgi:phage terminase small subunit